MPRNSTGQYTLPQAPFQTGTVISSAAVNSDFSDIATALTQSIASTGVTAISAPLYALSGSAAVPSWSFTSDTGGGMYLINTGIIGIAGNHNLIGVFDWTRAGSGQDGGLISYGNGAVLVPVGTIMNFAGSVVPSGWFACGGQMVSTASYPELFHVIGTTYGAGAGVFGLPDLRGRVAVGQDFNNGSGLANRLTTFSSTGIGNSGGDQNLQSHQHAVGAYAVNITDPSHSHTYNSLFVPGAPFIQAGGSSVGGGTSTGAAFTGISAFLSGASGFNGSGGGQNVQPTLILQKIIFAGRP
jgi:microcystin-dependent protein